MNNVEFVSVLSSALTPVTLISGVGLLMLTMSARYAHTTNRIRELLKSRLQIVDLSDKSDDVKLIDEEILLIFHRSKLLKRSILLS